MSVFYKFKSSLNHDTIQFDDLHISLQDFKKAVIQQKQLGKNTNFDLQVTNAETNEVYSEENSLIPKNSSLIVVRVPIAGAQKKPWDIGDQLGSKIGVLSSDYLQENAGNIVVKSADLAALNASEEDKIQAMMFQSTVDYDPSNYMRVKGGSQYGDPPANYVCHKCHHPGHWIKDCPITVVPDIKKSSGIPQSFMTPVDGPSVPGALMTPTGTFAVPTIDLHAYKEGKKEKPFIPSEEIEEVSKPIIPEDLVCTLCQDLLTDAVMMPCCGNSFCDDCIRNILIESEDNQCPDCKEKDTSPETLIPNRFLRNAVNNFRNKTGYRGGGQRSKPSEGKPEPAKSPTIENDDVEIIATIPSESIAKVESEPENEIGTAISVLGSGGLSHRGGRVPTNGAQNKMPTIHVEHRPPMGRPKPVPGENGSDGQRNLVSNGIKPSSESAIDEKPSVVPHAPPPVIPDRSRLSGPPPPINPTNTAQAPPGYNQGMPPMGGPYPGAVPPMMQNYGPPPPGVAPMVMPPQHMPAQPSVRMYPYTNQPVYTPPMNDRAYHRSVPGNRIRMHGDGYNDRNIVEDPWEAFERHLKEREKQDRIRRNRARRSRSRSHSRGKTRSVSRSRSRSRSLKKRSHSKSPPPIRKESSIKRESRSPSGAIRRSKSKSRSRTRLRTRSRSPAPRSGSRSPTANISKKKRSVSMSPVDVKKRSRSSSPVSKKPMRSNRTRSRTRTRSRSKSVTRSRKRRRTRSRSRSISSRRSFSRGRSYSRSPSPRSRRHYSPAYISHRVKRHSRSPSRHHASSSRYRPTNYRDGSPYVSGSYYESSEYRGYRRGSRNPRYPRGGRYNNSNQNYDYGNKYERYGNDRYEDKRYFDNNSRGYYGNNDHSRNRKDNYYPPPMDNYNQYSNTYTEVAPPGTTEPIPTLAYNANVPFGDTNNAYNTRNDKYRSPEFTADNSSYTNHNLKTLVEDDWRKSKDKDHDHYHRRSRERYHHSETDRERRHDSRSRYVSPSPNCNEKKRSHGRSRDKENKSRSENTGKRDSTEKYEYSDRNDRHDSKADVSPEKEKSRKDDDKKDDHKEKKDKSKRKKKKEKESDAEKKKKKKLKSKKEEEPKHEEPKIEAGEKELSDIHVEEKAFELDIKERDLYDGIEDTKVDEKIIENYGKIDKPDDQVPERSKNENLILASVPELSKWERDDEISPDDSKAFVTDSFEYGDKKVVTNEILKRAENALFQKSGKIPGKTSESKNEAPVQKEKEEIISLESNREARKSGNSIQVTVPVSSSSKSEDESKNASGRISAKDRLGAKVEEKIYPPIRSLVEPKVKPRNSQPALKSVVDLKHSSKTDSHKHDKHDDSRSKRHDDKRKKESSRHDDVKHTKHRDSKDSKEKRRRKSSEHESKNKKEIAKEKENTEKDKPPKESIEEKNNVEEAKKESETAAEDVKTLLEKKRPSLDEASFEPDYDLTSESEEEGESKSNGEEPEDRHRNKNLPEPVRDTKQDIEKALIQKIIEHTNNLSSSESSSESSSDSSVERKKRKKKKSKKRKKTKKRRTYSSDSESEESSESDSDSDAKHKRKKKHKHKNKKTRTSKKKKKTKHKS